MTDGGRSVERAGVTRGARALVGLGFAAAGILGFFLVRTFRSPALEAADTQTQQQTAVDDTGRDPVPPQATMPGVPDSGWMATSAGTAEAPPAAAAAPVLTTIGTDEAAPAAAPRSYVPSEPRVAPARRTYTDADLRAIAAQRGAGATRDHGYVVALRQRRVDDLRARLASARDGDERQSLMKWLDGAMDDLERARRE